MTDLPRRISVDDLPNSPARQARRRKSRALPKGERECDHQAAVIAWSRDPIVRQLRPDLKMLFHIPNGGLRSPIEAKRLVGQGVRPGVSDLFLAHPCHGWAGLFIEMKAGENDPSPEQLEFLRDVRARGYFDAVCWCAQDAIDVIEEYLDGKFPRRQPLVE